MTHFRADIIVVLGGLVRPDGSLGNALERRVRTAAHAFHHHLAPQILCSGGKSWNGHVEAVRMRDRLLDLHVDPDHILTELNSHCTAENAWYCAPLLRQRALSHALIVSCPWHLPRACADFHACGIHVSPLPSDCPPPSFRSKLWRSSIESVASLLDQLKLRRWKSS